MLALYLLLVTVNELLCQTTIVRTNNGWIVGQDRGDYETFFGIPYALVDEENPFGLDFGHPKEHFSQLRAQILEYACDSERERRPSYSTLLKSMKIRLTKSMRTVKQGTERSTLDRLSSMLSSASSYNWVVLSTKIIHYRLFTSAFEVVLAALRESPASRFPRRPRSTERIPATESLSVPRLTRSLPHPGFATLFYANNPSVKCPQLFPKENDIVEIQCLRLNIYVPKTTNKNIPVLVYIHGGGFIIGSAGKYDAKHLVQHDIIVVTINYRLGPYGFFCLNTDSVPGNQGLKDQVSALRWIKRNIAAFGGDPDKVTIGGESSVELHLYSENEKLFDKAIIQSGGADAEALFEEPNNNAAYTLAKTFDPEVKEQDALKLLSKQHPTEVMEVYRLSRMVLGTCEEREQPNKRVEHFFTANSKALHRPLKVSGTQIMIGYNSKETFAGYVKLPNKGYESDIFLEKIKNNFRLDEKTMKEAVQSVKSFYLGNKNISKDVMLELIDFTSDFMVNYPVERAVSRFLEQGALVYKYLFSYTGNSLYNNIEGAGVSHLEQLQYLFDLEAEKELKGEDNILMRDRMTALWANFVKYGAMQQINNVFQIIETKFMVEASDNLIQSYSEFVKKQVSQEINRYRRHLKVTDITGVLIQLWRPGPLTGLVRHCIYYLELLPASVVRKEGLCSTSGDIRRPNAYPQKPDTQRIKSPDCTMATDFTKHQALSRYQLTDGVEGKCVREENRFLEHVLGKLLPGGRTIDSELFCEQLMRLKQEVEKKRPESTEGSAIFDILQAMGIMGPL
ncbi:unnamed protein product [Chilo suppressalis]|uniref:Carboxylesterase type B domain-containing protein n=1 Tax=Chilo suppressalis TaxID=168631 RepID=A0ABN8B2F8_CHISP|nr:unnamed protein product [Chilo suppressalis]